MILPLLIILPLLWSKKMFSLSTDRTQFLDLLQCVEHGV